ncbi:hypothetical protein BJY01DRAFT_229507 [Aspergillus pseudoustus]|uniref:Uncharacterized protein n=1 Tax=Aspergillus pseudoustus TaxID=1810923 RepID=A0ABR4IJB9_9EURO
MSNLSNIRDQIFESQDAKRIAMKLKTRHLDSHDYLRSVKEVLNDIFPDFESDQRIRLLAIEIFPDRTYLVVDISNYEYNFQTAHEASESLPVYLLKVAHKGKNWALVRLPKEDQRLRERIAELHRSHGYDVGLPLIEDNTSSIVHANPRGPPPADSRILHPQ